MIENKKWARQVISVALLSLISTYAAAQFPMQPPVQQRAFPGYGPMMPPPPGNQIPPKPIPRNRLFSCLKKIEVQVAFDDDWLDRTIDVKAQAVNSLPVEVGIYHSHVQDGILYCQYRTVNRDIRNLVYSFPCRDGVKANNGYAHAWICR